MNPDKEPMSQEQMNQGQSQGQGVRADKGLGHYPISDLQFDVVTLVFEKSKALQAYDKYLIDCQSNEELRSIFEEIVADDRKHIEKLKNYLGNC
jgi:rubrerythrin